MGSEIAPKSMKIDLWASRARSGTPGEALGYPRGAPEAKMTSKCKKNTKNEVRFIKKPQTNDSNNNTTATNNNDNNDNNHNHIQGALNWYETSEGLPGQVPRHRKQNL